MATITPVRDSVQAGIERITWSLFSTADTATAVIPMGASGAIGCMQVTGTFGSATITLQGSNDGTNFYAITDAAGNDVAVATAAGIVDFSTAAAYIRPSSAGGTADDVTVTVVLRG